jgi:L-fuculose-phosphate aldolase
MPSGVATGDGNDTMRKNEYQLRQEIVQIGRRMYEKNFISASDGNISARLAPGHILITPSGLHKGFLEPDQLLIVDEEGERVAGSIGAHRHLRPTSELPMHLEAYRRRPDIEAVVHAHPPITVALSIAGIPMADCLLPEVIVFLGLIPTTQYATPSSHENIQAIRDLIEGHDAIILQRHGSITVGVTPMQAFMRLETVEQNARIGFMLAQLGVHNPLPAEEVRKLLQQRQEMGLSHPGEAAAFCTVCGVCHDGDKHAPTMRTGNAEVRATTIPSADPATIRMLVSQVVNKTLGSA